MAADETAQSQQSATRRRRGRPPGSKTTNRRKVGGGDLIAQLNTMVAELIKENRKLKRQVEKLTARGAKAASTTVERGLRTSQRRVQKALTGTKQRRRRTTKPVRRPSAARRPRGAAENR